ncbi:glycosyltransferase family 61 protein [Amaricoccus sp.]|uniref:glycosyltransferase 61 family protein n=1 Tax=Amaricoccus sp. TaxID=1872485 RepID=UPI002618A462|nr:glycosyltransferase family 61 protein [uncultured Amaricoccus sp.]
MRLNLEMLDWGLRRLWYGMTPDIRSMASKSRELCPEEVVRVPAAIHAPGEFDRVLRLAPHRDWATEHMLAAGGPCVHAASMAYEIEGVAISGAYIYRGPAKYKPGFGPEKLFTGDPPPTPLESACLVSNNIGSHYFGNFLLDELPLGLIPPPGAPTIVAPTKDYEHEAGYRALVDLPRPPVARRAWARRLTIYTDFAQNSYKEQRYRELRARAKANLARHAPVTGPGVYLKRGATGERRVLAEEAELEAMLEKLGFDIVEPAVLGVEEIARRTYGARIVIGVEGSHLSHAIFTMADDAAFLVLQPPDRFAMTYKEFADRMSMRFAFMVGTAAEDGFTVDHDRLRRIIDRVS